ncbi:hypothetical protein [Candidatus Sororendozoicomonas aggregata]|uniref:hypothetical protein n=1 Tax=Candidatus Sororendozoicomonas aggregata TaxID=3073239 RepID=UPI002ED2ED30
MDKGGVTTVMVRPNRLVAQEPSMAQGARTALILEEGSVKRILPPTLAVVDEPFGE